MRRGIIRPLFAVLLLLSFFTGSTQHAPDTLRLFLIGNSFSQNAGRYLPQLAAEGNHPLVIGRAEIGGCSLQKHWELAELAENNPDDPKGRAYKGKSLRMLLSEGKWDVVTLQQNSMNSGDPDTYRPYAQKLYDFIKSIQPDAKVVFHQTWAYRTDSKDFTQIAKNRYAQSAEEMWKASRTAYRTVAGELDIDLMPVGDAFWKVSADKKWGYKPDKEFDESSAVRPAVPEQANSLHVGYFWKKDSTLGFDSHHANEAGCFLGSLVWYTFLFDESPVRLKFVPEKVPADFGAYLKKTANSVVKR
ncbi:MAG: DUF4886 domain-containing protein [Prolixibacteraceae bacterium]